MNREFPPTRAAGLARLAAFAPRTGRAYASGRNADPGPDHVPATSGLSPYLRRRLVLEEEAVAAARTTCGPASEKFVQEVFWRTYWKGYLEQHPAIWSAYRAETADGWNRVAAEGGLRRVFEDATEGRTGLACFDAWARELVATNWLHNHTRMWFASIWIFTLRLPWALGADFFARHLIDGDPASNTLSWRWVAGLHTRGKAYAARAENIARYTDGRFNPVGELDENPAPLEEPSPPSLVPLPRRDPVPDGDVALLLHDDDCAELPPLGTTRVRELAGVCCADGFARNGVADRVAAFAAGSLDDALARSADRVGCEPERVLSTNLPSWVAHQGLPIVTLFPPAGPAADALAGLATVRVLRDWDQTAWPFARRGFFQLKERIPDVLGAVRSAA